METPQIEIIAQRQTESSGAYYPQDYSLESVDLETSSKQNFKLKNLVVEIGFFEDIYSFVVSGYIKLRDALGLIQGLQLDGNEFIHLKYGKIKDQENSGKNDKSYFLIVCPLLSQRLTSLGLRVTPTRLV